MLYCTTKLSCFKGLCNNPVASVPFSSKDFNYCHPIPSPTPIVDAGQSASANVNLFFYR